MTNLLNFIISLLALLSPGDYPSDCISAHNSYRQAVGDPDLSWSNDLANSAQNWANCLAQTGQFQHSGTAGVGENIAMGTQGAFSASQFVQMWGDEQKNFVPGTFPDVSKTGNWADVGHYTQIVWRQTTQVGCGIASGFGNDYMVCQYTPPGNVEGQNVY